MDPWSKENYSRDIREASMVERRLQEVGPPSGRVPGRGLLVLPISEARRRRNRGEIAKRVLFSRFSRDGEYIGKGGQPEVDQGPQAPPGAARGGAAPGGHLGHPRLPSGPTRALREASCTLIFYLIFPEFLEHFLYGGKLK